MAADGGYRLSGTGKLLQRLRQCPVAVARRHDSAAGRTGKAGIFPAAHRRLHHRRQLAHDGARRHRQQEHRGPRRVRPRPIARSPSPNWPMPPRPACAAIPIRSIGNRSSPCCRSPSCRRCSAWRRARSPISSPWPGHRVTRGAVTGGNRRMAELTTVQMRVAEASALIDAARLLMIRDLAQAFETAARGEPISIDMRLRNRRDQAFCVRLLVAGHRCAVPRRRRAGIVSGERRCSAAGAMRTPPRPTSASIGIPPAACTDSSCSAWNPRVNIERPCAKAADPASAPALFPPPPPKFACAASGRASRARARSAES